MCIARILFLFTYFSKCARLSDRESRGTEGGRMKCWLVDDNPCHNFFHTDNHTRDLWKTTGAGFSWLA